ncbi:hypothetical protein NDU88_004107 [Pleurodeles waltl]|uniref:Uncharacterized protein n=1 Tax=Pleurodeles waltl TaxID=8319 RepID=A0AAV7MAQ1_PLEWA|nr:hypothetical protein NDU88_004107 [Pleurodeles waltl]
MVTPKTVVCWERPWMPEEPGPILGGAQWGRLDSAPGAESTVMHREDGFPSEGTAIYPPSDPGAPAARWPPHLESTYPCPSMCHLISPAPLARRQTALAPDWVACQQGLRRRQRIVGPKNTLGDISSTSHPGLQPFRTLAPATSGRATPEFPPVVPTQGGLCMKYPGEA